MEGHSGAEFSGQASPSSIEPITYVTPIGFSRATHRVGTSAIFPPQKERVRFMVHKQKLRKPKGREERHSAAWGKRLAIMLLLATGMAFGANPHADNTGRIASELSDLLDKAHQGTAKGQTVKVIAADSGTSTNTVRTHVNAVLTKTGYSRQSDVVALLNGLRPPGSASDA